MQSDGTTAGAEIIRERPFLIIESGPAAGVSAAARLAAEMGRDAIITFDMGGTTAKASLVEHSGVDLAPELEVGNSINRGGGFMRSSGYLVRAACVDLTEVGSGGGSIAWIDRGGGLRSGRQRRIDARSGVLRRRRRRARRSPMRTSSSATSTRRDRRRQQAAAR